MTGPSNLDPWIVVWMCVTALVVHQRLRHQATGSGLVVAYFLNLWAIHGLGAWMYTLPWWRGEDAYGLVEAGFRQATVGLLAAAVGSVGLAPLLMRALHIPTLSVAARVPTPRLANAYVLIGIVCYLVVLPLTHGAATVTALVAAGWRLLVAGLGLLLWQAWWQRRIGFFIVVFVIGLAGLPALTVTSAGFLSYGSSAALALFVFVANFVRPRWKVFAAGAVIGYVGLSFYVTYMRGREEIREAVWQRYELSERMKRFTSTLTQWEWIDFSKEEHFDLVDERLNQNWLVGAAVQYMDSGFAAPAKGQTIGEALLSLIPRALWPEKPITAGSGDLVSMYTGIMFAEGTSVGIGQIMEFYINFGTGGVALGCLLIGALLSILDSAAGQRLRQGDWQGFAYWYLPGLSLLNVEGSLVETTASMGAAIVTAYLVNRYLLRRFRGRRLAVEELETA